MARGMVRLARCARGATAVEYGLMLALVVIGLIGAIAALGSSTSGRWGNVAAEVSAAEPQ